MYSETLTQKINKFKEYRRDVPFGQITATSPLILAPMAGICTAPFRLIMQELGSGFTVSELISCHGINYKNDRTMKMLKLHPDEKNVGIQLFGEIPSEMAKAAKTVQDYNPDFVDINMGCPVRKVVSKGGGSALMKSPKDLVPYLKEIKNILQIPLTIKIRMGWDADGINADEIIKIAHGEGIEFVAVHGRTRAQQYNGTANWDYIEKIKEESPLPLIGNGDLHSPMQVYNRLAKTKCDGLMIARGALRNPFIFLEGLVETKSGRSEFTSSDYLEVINRLFSVSENWFDRERTILVQMRKLIVWFAAGFPSAASFRGLVFKTKTIDELKEITNEYFLSLEGRHKRIKFDEAFMTSGHG